jgi:hypothetical protein
MMELSALGSGREDGPNARRPVFACFVTAISRSALGRERNGVSLYR